MSILTAKLSHYLETNQTFRAVYDYTKQRFTDAPQLYAHNFEHCRRDTMNSIAIGEAEGADIHIVLCATIMHDIGYLYGGNHREHGPIGADHLADYLSAASINLDPVTQSHIADCIRTHKGSAHQVAPATLEAKVVADADELDKLGPIGIFQESRAESEFGFTIERILSRRQKPRDFHMFTKTGERMAAERKSFSHQFSAAFVKAYAAYLDDKAEEYIS